MRGWGGTKGPAILALILLLPVFSAPAACLPPPRGEVLLRVSGAIGCTNLGGEARFDLALLESLGVARLVTRTPWTEGEGTFEGVTARRLLDAVRARGGTVRAIALNDYEAEIPVEELVRHEVLIAWKRDGRRLRRRGKGPLWIVYPWSEHPELDTRLVRQHSVWQLDRLVIR